jgi:hypothetical protein
MVSSENGKSNSRPIQGFQGHLKKKSRPIFLEIFDEE